MPGDLLTLNPWAAMLVFARMSGIIMLMPGIGEVTIPARIRLTVALILTLTLIPVVSPALPADLPAAGRGAPEGVAFAAIMTLLLRELITGIALGALMRLAISGLSAGGSFIAYNTGLGSAQLFDPNAGQQGAIIGAFVTSMGLTAMFVTGLHQPILRTLAESYHTFPPGAPLPAGDFADTAARLVADGFRFALAIAMPVIFVAVFIYLAMGVMARLMPQIQIFFIGLPLQILTGFLVLALTLSTAMLLFLEGFADNLARLFALQ